jgi:long-chain acyl-CoA synthetase
MTPKELLAEGEYQKIKAQDMQKATALYESIQSSTDRFMKHKDQRPVMDLRHMLQTSVERFGEKPAFHEKPSHNEPYRDYSYKDTLADVNAIGTALHAHGLRGSRIAVIGDNGYAWATAYLSVVCGAGIVVPLDKELNRREVEGLLIESEAECVFYTKKFEDMFAEISMAGKTKLRVYINMDGDELADYEVSRETLIAEGRRLLSEGNREFLDAQIIADEMGILLFTSGTTGIAKGVMLSHRNLCTDMMISPTVMHVGSEDIFFSVLPMHHTYECTCGFLIPLYRGASVAYCEGLKYIVSNLAEAKPTMFLAVPLLFENLYSKVWQNVRKQGKEKLLKTVLGVNKVTKKIGLDLGDIFLKDIRALFGGKMRLMIVGGAAIDPAIIDGIKAFGINMLQGYGLTECSPICALNPEYGGKSDSAGYLVPGFDGRIDDPDPETGIGEICVRGDFVMLGYYNNQEATDAVMRDGWFHTGDYGYIDADRFVHITGRKKSVIITKNGKNVFPEELEYLISRSPYIESLMVWEKETQTNEDTTIAATVKVNRESVSEVLGSHPADEQLIRLIWDEIDRINAELPFFKKIKKVYLRDADFEVTTSKKIKRFVTENREGREI